jgi:O6-methylguanine-DNA--protein-cysteine methyltransferase
MENKSKKNNQEELKKKLHELIDSIEDEHTLSVLNEDIVPYIIENRTKEADEANDDLTEEQEKKLEQAIKEADEGKTMSYEEFKQRMSRWLTD